MTFFVHTQLFTIRWIALINAMYCTLLCPIDGECHRVNCRTGYQLIEKWFASTSWLHYATRNFRWYFKLLSLNAVEWCQYRCWTRERERRSTGMALWHWWMVKNDLSFFFPTKQEYIKVKLMNAMSISTKISA